MSSDGELRNLVDQLLAGQLSVEQLRDQYSQPTPATAVTSDARVDLDRRQRCGFSEVVFCEGKTPETVVEIFRQLHHAGQDALGTRCSLEMAEHVCGELPEVRYNQVARTLTWCVHEPAADVGPVAVVAAGTSDRAVAEEAVETAAWMGCQTQLLLDVGVAGPQRLLEVRDQLRAACAIVVVAGMEGALPSVVGGHVACPVIAVPTSVGYGANLGGFAALLSMLNSCAANVTVVNIDAGFKGGYIAGLIARQSASRPDPPSDTADRPPT